MPTHHFAQRIRFLPPRNASGATQQDLHATVCLDVLSLARVLGEMP